MLVHLASAAVGSSEWSFLFHEPSAHYGTISTGGVSGPSRRFKKSSRAYRSLDLWSR